MSFSKALYAILAVIVVHVISLITNLYYYFPDFDVPMHFFGGFVMGMLGVAIHHFEAGRSHTARVSLWYHYLFVIGFVMLVAVAWEFHEYILDQTFVVWFDWQKTQPSLADTMADLALGFTGGSLAFLRYRKGL